jgi:hypothetical protein
MRSAATALAVSVTALLLTACSSSGGERGTETAVSPPPVSPAPVASPRVLRPLDLPRIERGGRCPVAPARRISPAFGVALGGGPAYPVLGGTVLEFQHPPPANTLFAGSGWGGQKVLWIVDPKRYEGPLLVRGRRLDGPQELRFGTGVRPRAELRLDTSRPEATEGGWPNFPSYTRLRAPGCYAYRVDGTDFSAVIVFEARIVAFA